MERLRKLAAEAVPFLVVLFGLTLSQSGAKAASDSEVPGANLPLRVESLDDDERPQLTLRLVEDLSFGKVVAGARSGGAVVIDAATGRRTVRGGVVGLGGRYGRAEFVVRGTPNTRFRIIYADKGEMVGKSGRARLIDINAIPERTGTIGRNGEAVIFVGATLELRRDQPSGSYRGSFNIRTDSDVD